MIVQVATIAAASARDRIALPFTCAIEQGRLRVEPAGEQSYPIAGPRDQQPFTYCPTGDGGRCRSFMVHRFAVQCTGGKAMWPEIVAAAGREQGRVVIENGQLLLRLGPRRTGAGEPPCNDGDRVRGRQPVRWQPCQLAGYASPRNAMRTHLLALPRGYAPLGLIGARVQLESEPQRPQSVLRGPEPAAAVTSGSLAVAAVPKQIARAVASEVLEGPRLPPLGDIVIETLPSLPEPVRGSPTPAIIEQALLPSTMEQARPLATGWTTRVEMSAASAPLRDEGAPAVSRQLARLVALALAATALLLATAVLIRRRTTPSSWRQPQQAGLATAGGDGPRAVALRSKAEGHIALVTGALDQLTTVAPLRSALARDLQASERRLAVVLAGISAATAGADDWTRARRRLERIAHDLDRLQQIAESAVSSLSGVRAGIELPRSVDEAYAALGVTPGVSDAILKKLVEALRVSWHPDLARNEVEREQRTRRMTEINVAWDLITGKRAGG